jgi:hypothetical protein
MAIYYYLSATNAQQAIPLGRSTPNSLGYEGPVVWICGNRYRLPDKYLSLLIERFRKRHRTSETVIYADYELFDSEKVVAQEDDILVVGGDRDTDPPLEEYLPEIKQPDVIAELVKDKKFLIE